MANFGLANFRLTNLHSKFSHWLAVRTPDPAGQRRGHLMALFLITAIVMMLALFAIDLTEHLTGYVTDPAWLIADVTSLVCLSGLFILNRLGRVRAAALGAILLVLTTTAVLTPLDTYDNRLVLLALPVTLSSFVAFPAASLITAILATATYTVMNLLFKSSSFFNYFGMLVLVLLAITIWQVSRWLDRALREARAAEADLRQDIIQREQIEKDQQAAHARLASYYQDAVSVDRVSRALTSALDAPTIYQVLYREIARDLLGAAHLMVAMYDEPEQLIRCAYAVIDRQEVDLAQFSPYALGAGPISDTIRTREGRIIDLNVIRRELEPQGRAVHIGQAADRPAQSGLYVPLLSGERVMGVLSVQHDEPAAFNERHLLLMTTVANQVAVALKNAELFATLEQRVTERTAELQTANRALRESEERLRAVSEATPIPLLIARLSDTTILSANTPVSEMFATRREALLGQPARKYMCDQARFSQLASDVRRDGVVQNIELEVLKATGQRFWVVIAMRLLVFGGEPAMVIGFYDVTERKQAEQAVLDSEEKFRSVIEQSRDGILLIDDHGYIVEWNHGMEDLIGWPRTRMLGRRIDQTSLRSLLGVDQLQLALDQLRAAAHLPPDQLDLAPLSRLIEQDATRRDGTHRTLQLMLFPIYLEKSAMYCAIIRDITDRINMEHDLRDSEALFRQITENIHEVVWMSLPDRSRMLYISPSYEEMWGRTCASLYADPQSFTDAVHPDDRSSMQAFLAKQQRGEPAFAEYRIIRPDNTIGWIWDRAFPIHDEIGQLVRVVGIAEDITTRKLAEEELRRALTAEQELGEIKSQFITMTSHEFRAPLTGILSAAELLEHYGDKWTDDKRQHYLHQIQANVTSMNQLLEQVLIIGRSSTHKLEFHPIRLALDNFCRDLVEEVQLGQATHIIRFTADLPPGDQVELDEQLLRHILINLLTNAIQYSPGAEAVEFQVSQCGNDIVFRVTDRGLGIPPAARARLFETFYRAENVAGIQGTGPGLSIVKQAVELHGGSIEYASEVDRGTTFTVKLPAHSSPLEELSDAD